VVARDTLDDDDDANASNTSASSSTPTATPTSTSTRVVSQILPIDRRLIAKIGDFGEAKVRRVICGYNNTHSLSHTLRSAANDRQ
jgi:hypothetical protein